MKSGVYRIVNQVNGKAYVGSAVNIQKRWIWHRSALRGGKHHSVKLQRAWLKYGEESFLFEAVESCDLLDLIRIEQKWIDELNSSVDGYNICGRAGSRLGVPLSEATKEKLRQKHLGKKISAEAREKMSLAQRGKTLSAEHRRKIGQSQVGKVIPLSSRLLMSEARRRKAREFSDLTRQKLSIAAQKANAAKAARRASGHVYQVAKKPPNLVCAVCAAPFRAIPSDVLEGAKYCSQSCYHAGRQSDRQTRTCRTCKEKFSFPKSLGKFRYCGGCSTKTRMLLQVAPQLELQAA